MFRYWLVSWIWDLSLRSICLGKSVCNISFGNCRLLSFAWKLAFGYFAWEISVDVFRLRFAWELYFWIFRLEAFAWDPSVDIFRLDCFAWELSFLIFHLGTFAWDSSLVHFRLRSCALKLSIEKCLWTVGCELVPKSDERRGACDCIMSKGELLAKHPGSFFCRAPRAEHALTFQRLNQNGCAATVEILTYIMYVHIRWPPFSGWTKLRG